ncbi:sulfatase-like hydrolase/transferase [Oligosphaera ethanolica]|uniref:Membrane-anchored protein YejM (Alkaline phosphatase superfamily) n=1 Tax=Oligosphaera ethanolica TaxID=760260 RepID=A0AAE4APB0_9BACT|nr:sulfatase-like hydrolase/transferase [Oligosphaera ethanolica]MDQ0291129.1 membrane-anchored protein YejM (alkaline phosphatase superfamily) [Oligosphaera ethanolica]
MHPPALCFSVYSLSLILLTLPLTGWFVWYDDSGDGPFRAVFLASSWLAYTVIYLLPAIFFSYQARLCSDRWGRDSRPTRSCWFFAGTAAFLCQLYLISDGVMLQKFGYHLNGLVWNLLITPGGFESMGIEYNSILPILAGVSALAALHAALVTFSRQGRAVHQRLTGLLRPWLQYLFGTLFVLSLCLSLLCTGLADFYRHNTTLTAIDALPLVFTLRMRRFLRSIGGHEPERDDYTPLDVDCRQPALLNYPRQPIVRDADRQRPPIIWLLGESLRADMLRPDIMPATWAFAQRSQRFLRHYSGGYGTRPGVFAMFYGLYGNYWYPFLKAHRSPLLIDWLQEDGYQFLCQTSARFSYPEFTQTIFAELPPECLHEDDRGKAWERDQRNTDRAIAFLHEQENDRQPFFLFNFFEVTHSPYQFCPDCVIREPYLESINYNTLGPEDAAALKNRYVNAARCLDSQFGRIIAALDELGLSDRCMVIITGDHGEEFFEKGHVGHNSTFVEEQIHVPLLIHAPGIAPGIYSGLSHHCDIVPMLAPLLGVSNPAVTYSNGVNLLAGDRSREYLLVTGWDLVAFISNNHKAVFPMSDNNLYSKRSVSDLQDQPCKDPAAFYRQNRPLLSKARQDMLNFIIPLDN